MSLEMKIPILEASILFFQVFFGFTFGTSFVIDRNSYFDVTDTFVIPRSICALGSTNQECEPFQANRLDLSCSCHCSGENATFIFHHSKWACLAHDEVRKLQDCNKTTFFTEGELNPSRRLLGLHVNDGAIRDLDIPFGEPTGWQQCELNLNRSWVLGCHGSLLRSSRYLSKMRELFSFTPSQSYFSLQVTGEVPGARMLQGRIVNLGIRCTNSSQHQYHGCLMFKLTGQQTCPVTVPSAQTSFAMSLQPTILTGTPTPIAATSQVLTIAPATGTQSTSAAKPTTPADSTVTSSTAIPFLPDVRSQPTSARDRGQRTTNGLYFLGLTAAIIVSPVLLVFCAFGLMVYGGRRSKKTRANNENIRRETRQDAMVMNAQTNSAFQFLENDETGYKIVTIDGMERRISWYASTYSVPRHLTTNQDNRVSGSLPVRRNTGEGHNICGPENTQEPLYYVIEELTTDSEAHSQRHTFSCSKQPVFSVNEELSNAEGPEGPTNRGAEPVSNILEGPNLEVSESTGQCGPISAEGPDDSECTNEPVYYVLEEDNCPGISAEDRCDIKNSQEPDE